MTGAARADPGTPAGRWSDGRYAARVLAWEALTDVVTPSLLDAVAAAPGERVLDVGCGAGAATRSMAARVLPGGCVIGADVSPAVVQLAEGRAAGVRNVRFAVADLSGGKVGGGPFDAVVSQFGVLFFADPVRAFGNLRAHLAPGGRLCFTCWQSAERNPWSFGPLLADLRSPGWQATPGGPFSLADEQGVRTLLRDAGFSGCTITPHEVTADLPQEAVVDDDELAMMGIAPRRMPEAWQRVEAHLRPYRTAGRRYRLRLAWYVVRCV
jgi:SAM-dependent methyltransferase